MANLRGRAFGNHLGRPADSWIDDDDSPLVEYESSDGYERMLQAVRELPGMEIYVVRALCNIADCGFDPTEPEAIEKAIESARRQAAFSAELQERALANRRAHDPVVYYMRVGNRVKIGTTANIMARLEAVAPEELMTMEWGARAVELRRHREFAALRTAREWFRLEGEVADHVLATAAAFEERFGQPLKLWMNGHRAVRDGN